jgi:hypothetical protein
MTTGDIILNACNSFKFGSSSTGLEDLYIQEREVPPPHQYREVVSLVSRSNRMDILLPENPKNLHDALFPLHRQIESQYRDLPWPVQMQKIVVFTDVRGGRGDIAAAAKVIAIMQKICPLLTFDWILNSTKFDAMSFLNCRDPSKVQVRVLSSVPPENMPGDLLLVGPVLWQHEVDYIPTFGFMEIAERDSGPYYLILTHKSKIEYDVLRFSKRSRYHERTMDVRPIRQDRCR